MNATSQTDSPESSPSTAPLSIVIPLYNEEDSVGPLIERTNEALANYPDKWELLLVDDGSSDGTVQKVCQLLDAQNIKHVRLIELQRNFGQTAAVR